MRERDWRSWVLSPDCLDKIVKVGVWSEAIDVYVCSIFSRFFRSVRHLGCPGGAAIERMLEPA